MERTNEWYYQVSCASMWFGWMVPKEVIDEKCKGKYDVLSCCHYGACISDVNGCRDRYIKDTKLLRELGYEGPIPDFAPACGR